MSKDSKIDKNDFRGLLLYLAIIVFVLVALNWDKVSSFFSNQNVTNNGQTTCKDVTSYDYNWDNDMLCTRPDGSTFYTSYQGARDAESR